MSVVTKDESHKTAAVQVTAETPARDAALTDNGIVASTRCVVTWEGLATLNDGENAVAGKDEYVRSVADWAVNACVIPTDVLGMTNDTFCVSAVETTSDAANAGVGVPVAVQARMHADRRVVGKVTAADKRKMADRETRKPLDPIAPSVAV